MSSSKGTEGYRRDIQHRNCFRPAHGGGGSTEEQVRGGGEGGKGRKMLIQMLLLLSQPLLFVFNYGLCALTRRRLSPLARTLAALWNVLHHLLVAVSVCRSQGDSSVNVPARHGARNPIIFTMNTVSETLQLCAITHFPGRLPTSRTLHSKTH